LVLGLRLCHLAARGGELLHLRYELVHGGDIDKANCACTAGATSASNNDTERAKQVCLARMTTPYIKSGVEAHGSWQVLMKTGSQRSGSPPCSSSSQCRRATWRARPEITAS
jgi:hypothetical protein